MGLPFWWCPNSVLLTRWRPRKERPPVRHLTSSLVSACELGFHAARNVSLCEPQRTDIGSGEAYHLMHAVSMLSGMRLQPSSGI